ncbi:microtubule cross-linking factor 3 isoform X3 [Pseudophryne corroboree]|uniref:microtubule cross-linking factor 3 isoform X3 n=1 Tax=Pseudophryne corroboree TaxID=495146 RepID=UPI0030817A3A
MWDGNENTPRLCNWQGYQCRYGTCNLSASRSKVKNRARSHSPLKNSVSHPAGAALLEGNSCQYTILSFQEQNVCLKQKCDELRRQHKKERKVWMKEKEGLLKETTELKAGENRGILLELKAVLEVIQREQRREEKKWTDFLLQFLSDRCGWGTDRIELQQHIPKPEANSAKTCANKSIPDIPKDTRKEKIEQRRLLEDTHTAAMELKTQLENNERNWKVEKIELLERFDSERKEWECQWKTMQKKIEELYQEVKLRREKTLNGDDDRTQEKMLQFALPFSQPEAMETPNIERQSHQNHMVNTKMEKSNRILLNDCLHINKERTAELKLSHQKHDVRSIESEKGISQRMSKTENDTLNDALKEIARVSEELCKYQEEIRTRTSSKKIVSSKGSTSEYKKHFYLKTERNRTSCSKMSTTKQKDSVSSSKTIQAALFSTAKSLHSEKDALSSQAQDPTFPSFSFSWHLPNSSFPDMNTTSAMKDNQVSSNGEAADFGLNDNSDGLCTMQWLCDIGGLEDINITESLFNSFTDVKCLTPEKNKQNMSLSQHGCLHSNSLYPDVIMLEDPTTDPGYKDSNNKENGKLSAKIDEFNRIVFKTGKGNAVIHEASMDVVLDVIDEDEKPSSLSLCERPVTGNTTKKPLSVNEIIEPTCANGSFHNSKSVKATSQQHHTTAPQTAKSYKNRLQEHNWKQINLSGRPRSADSRSNYGVVEKLLKSYETKAAAPFCNSKQSLSKWTQSDFLLTDNSSESLTQCLEMLHLEQATNVLQSDIHWQSKQEAMSLKLPEISLTTSSNGKGFSRPARPANRRPPSRWASARSPSMSAAVRRATH